MALQSTIRGHQAIFKFYQDGQEVVIDSITKVDVNQDAQHSKHVYVGNPIPERDTQYLGWNGSFEMEVRNDVIEKFMDALIAGNLNGIGVSDYTFIIRELYPDGTQSSYAYTDVVFSMARTQGGMDTKVMKTINFEAGTRIPLA